MPDITTPGRGAEVKLYRWTELYAAIEANNSPEMTAIVDDIKAQFSAIALRPENVKDGDYARSVTVERTHREDHFIWADDDGRGAIEFGKKVWKDSRRDRTRSKRADNKETAADRATRLKPAYDENGKKKHKQPRGQRGKFVFQTLIREARKT